MNDSRAFMIVMFGLTTFLCFMVGRSVHMVYDHMPLAPAQEYRNTVPIVPSNAVIDAVGYEYVGTCRFLERDDGGHGDSVCDSGSQETNRLCRPYLHTRFPVPGEDPTEMLFRRLSDEMLSEEVGDDEISTEEDLYSDGVDGNFSFAEARRLRGHGHGHSTSCYNRYAAWLRVNLTTVEGTPVQRCSYRYGTKANSQTLSWNYVRDEQENRAVGDQISVWASNISDTCIVVHSNISNFQTYIEQFTHQKDRIVPLYYLFFFFAGLSCLCIIRWMFFAEDTPEGEDAKKKSEEDEEEEEEEEDSE